MGEINRDIIERQFNEGQHANGLKAAIALLSEHPQGVTADKFKHLSGVLETCAGPDDDCPRCAQQVECARAYDEIAARIK
jgi:hypothetical protein